MAKIVCGKAVSISDMTYEEVEEQAEKVFRLAYKDISLNGDVTGKVKPRQAEEIKELKQAIGSLQTDLQALRTREKVALEKIQELTDYIVQVDGALSHHRSKEIQEIYEDIKAGLGLKIESLSKKLDRLMTFVGFKPDKQHKSD